jgi:hypothetical protein
MAQPSPKKSPTMPSHVPADDVSAVAFNAVWMS